LEGLAIEDVGIFYGHLVRFTVFCYILWTFGIVCGNFLYFSILVFCTKKNLATLVQSGRPAADVTAVKGIVRTFARQKQIAPFKIYGAKMKENKWQQTTSLISYKRSGVEKFCFGLKKVEKFRRQFCTVQQVPKMLSRFYFILKSEEIKFYSFADPQNPQKR
jgi:hypothetical protein